MTRRYTELNNFILVTLESPVSLPQTNTLTYSTVYLIWNFPPPPYRLPFLPQFYRKVRYFRLPSFRSPLTLSRPAPLRFVESIRPVSREFLSSTDTLSFSLILLLDHSELTVRCLLRMSPPRKSTSSSPFPNPDPHSITLWVSP